MMTEPCTSSGEITVSTTVVCAAPARLCDLTLNPGSATSSVVVYDNATTNSGTILAKLIAPANAASVCLTLIAEKDATKGITIVVAGTAASAVLGFHLTR